MIYPSWVSDSSWQPLLSNYGLCPTKFCFVFVSPVQQALAAEHTAGALLF